MLLNRSDDLEVRLDEIENSRKNAEIAYSTLQKTVGSEQSPELMQKIASYYSTYIKNAQQVVDLFKAGRTQEANEHMLVTGEQSRSQLLQSVQTGGRHDIPQIRRHRPRPVDLPRDRSPSRRPH